MPVAIAHSIPGSADTQAYAHAIGLEDAKKFLQYFNHNSDSVFEGSAVLIRSPVAAIFQELIQDYSDELALAALTRDFVDYSSAVSIIINGGDDEPLDIVAPTFVGRRAFMDAQGSQPKIPFKKLNIFQ